MEIRGPVPATTTGDHAVHPTAISRLTSLLALLFVGIGTAAAQLPPPPAEPVVVPRGLGEMKFEKTLHDFGNIWDHEKAEHRFKFTNVGSDTLVITDTQSSCGCTIPEVDPKVYEPGESGEIVVIFNPENRPNNQRKTVYVTTDSRTTPRVALTFTANVTKVLDIQPRIANLGRVFKGEEKGMKIHILGKIEGFKAVPAEEQPEDTLKFFDFEFVEAAPVEINGEIVPRSTLRVALKPGLPVGRHSSDLLVKTNDDRRPEATIRATVTVVGDLQARPPRFALGRVAPAEEFEAKVVLVNRVADPFKITKIEVGPELEGVEVAFKPVVEGQNDAYEIIAKGVAPAEQTRILGNITVYTDMQGEEQFELPIYGFVSGGAQIGQARPAVRSQNQTRQTGVTASNNGG
jgi:hypothetical protein